MLLNLWGNIFAYTALFWTFTREHEITEMFHSTSLISPTAKSRLAYICISILRDLKLRNYTPEDEELKLRQVPKAKPASGENSSIISKPWMISMSVAHRLLLIIYYV